MTSRIAANLRQGTAALTCAVVVAAVAFVARAQAPFDFGPPQGFGGSREIELVKQFDRNGDKRLDTDERKAARASVTASGGRRGRGGPPPFGGPDGRSTTPPAPGPRLAASEVRRYASSTPLYDPGALRTIFLQFDGADWEQELADFHDTDVEVPATMTVDGQTLRDVGVHFRGMSSFMMVPQGYKRSLNLSLDFAREGQQLGGYRTLNLLNANSDPTFVRGVLYTDIARQYLPTPRMNHVRVVINGESWGVYLNAQQFNRDFTRENFGSSEGARWKVPGSPGGRGGLEYLGESPESYKRLYDIKSKDSPKAWTDLIALTRVLNQTPPEKLEAALRPILDVDGVLKFLAIEVALVNTDGYWTRASDYSIYQDPQRVFHIVPHDVNEGLGTEEGGGRRGGGFGPPPGLPPDGLGGPGGFRGGRGPGRGPGGGGGPELDPLVGLNDASKPLRSKLLAVPALRERYLGYVRDIAQKHLNWATMSPRVRQYQALIAADVAGDTRKLYSTDAFTSSVARLQSFVEQRRSFLLR